MVSKLLFAKLCFFSQNKRQTNQQKHTHVKKKKKKKKTKQTNKQTYMQRTILSKKHNKKLVPSPSIPTSSPNWYRHPTCVSKIF